eukprot:2765898-Amphidinium_carterae.2
MDRAWSSLTTVGILDGELAKPSSCSQLKSIHFVPPLEVQYRLLRVAYQVDWFVVANLHDLNVSFIQLDQQFSRKWSFCNRQQSTAIPWIVSWYERRHLYVSEVRAGS